MGISGDKAGYFTEHVSKFGAVTILIRCSIFLGSFSWLEGGVDSLKHFGIMIKGGAAVEVPYAVKRAKVVLVVFDVEN